MRLLLITLLISLPSSAWAQSKIVMAQRQLLEVLIKIDTHASAHLLTDTLKRILPTDSSPNNQQAIVLRMQEHANTMLNKLQASQNTTPPKALMQVTLDVVGNTINKDDTFDQNTETVNLLSILALTALLASADTAANQ